MGENMGTQVKSAEQIRMKFALPLSAFVASTFAAPKATNALTCNICVDIITDIDEFITDTTTEDQIVQFFKEICHTLGSVMGSPPWRPSAMPYSSPTFPRLLTTSSTRILILSPSVQTSACVHESILS